MYRLFIVCFLLISTITQARQNDSMYVIEKDRSWLLIHRVQEDETVFSIARKYHVPPAMLASENNVSYQTVLTPGKKIYVPIGAYNFLNDPAQVRSSETRPLYYRVAEDMTLYKVARVSGVTQRKLQDWNQLDYLEITAGMRLLVGWVRFDATNMQEVGKKKGIQVSYDAQEEETKHVSWKISEKKLAQIQEPEEKNEIHSPVTPTVTDNKMLAPNRGIIHRDTMKVLAATPSQDHDTHDSLKDPMALYDPSDSLTEAGRVYLQQTYLGQSVTEEKGPAAFYDHSGPADVYFAFHNTAPRGKIIKVTNPGNGKYVFVKVLGPIPQTKLYHNCIIGLSGNAREALGVVGNKSWCTLQYAP
jgi:LysM repeat protein